LKLFNSNFENETTNFKNERTDFANETKLSQNSIADFEKAVDR
jgi:hypothetical protein